MSIATVSPLTNRVVKKFRELSDKALAQQLNEAQKSLPLFNRMPMTQRSGLMKAVAESLELQKESLAQLITEEMGKPIAESTAEIEKCVRVCEFYSEHAKDFLKDEPVETEASSSFVYLFTTRNCSGCDAMELSFLAGFPVCCPCYHGWQPCSA